MERTTTQVIEGLDEVWSSLLAATEDLGDSEWSQPTECPGWDVRDQLGHLAGIERTLQGILLPLIEVEPRSYVKNTVGEVNEVWIEWFRRLPAVLVRSEFELVTRERLAELRSLPDVRFEALGSSPIGEVPMLRYMELRIMDSWLHEQDVRHALGRPGGRHGIGERIALEHVDRALGVVVGKLAKVPEGSSVAFEIEGPLGGRCRMEVVDGRARSVPAEQATATISLSQETYVRRYGGRVSRAEALERQGSSIEGDRVLGEAVLEALSVMI
jgi:uncharacterized protein (TIGR03083 family)